jgi:protoporphyrinogen oxidase
MQVDILIIGSGPTGLGASYYCNKLGYPSWLLVEASDSPGGLAKTIDYKGFKYDIGGHVIFSHYKEFDGAIQEALGPFQDPSAWNCIERKSTCFKHNIQIPYPFQCNFHLLGNKQFTAKVVDELLATSAAQDTTNFHLFLETTYGKQLCEIFMLPYNEKVWAHDLYTMNAQWVAERVAKPNLPKIMKNIIYNTSDSSWGPNATFHYPVHGTGSIYENMAERLPREKIMYSEKLVKLDSKKRIATFASGLQISYHHLITTVPLDVLLNLDTEEFKVLKQESVNFLKYSSTHVVGLGMDDVSTNYDASWSYFVDKEVPFYRATFLSNYSSKMVPYEGMSSILLEVAEGPLNPIVDHNIVWNCIDACDKLKLIPITATIDPMFYRRFEYGYPTPTLGLHAFIKKANTFLEERRIHTRGRFGMWLYEISNQDHSFMQGYEVARKILRGTAETVITNALKI